MLSRARTAFFCVVAVASVAAMWLFPTTSTASPGRPADGPVTPPAPTSSAPAPQPYDAASLSAALQNASPAGFGGIYYAPDGSLVVQYNSSSALSHLQSVKAQYDAAQPVSTPATQFQSVAHAFSRLQQLQGQATAAHADLQSGGATVNFVGVDVPANRLRVGLATNSPAAQATVLRVLGATADELEFAQAEPVPAAAERFNDVPSWNAGDRIFNTNAPVSGCSSGFGIHSNQTGHHYLITAAHCSSYPGLDDFFWNGSAGCGYFYMVCDPDPLNTRLHGMGFSTSADFTDWGWDTQLIDAPSNDIVWTAVSSRSYITASYMPIANDINRVINEGATSYGWQSGLMNIAAYTNVCEAINYDQAGVHTICHLWAAVQPAPGECAVKPGDSGGPVVSYSGFGPLAIGEIIAGDCGTVLFHSIKDMELEDPWLIPYPAVNTTSSP